MWYNTVIAGLLGSPLHGTMSKSVMLLTYTGRKSGKTYEVPVNYLEQDGHLLVTSSRDRTWWRNLRDGAPVTLTLRGKQVAATGTAVEDEAAVREGLTRIVATWPQYAKYFGVTATDPAARQTQIAEAAKTRLLVRFTLA